MNPILQGREARREWICGIATPDAIALAEHYGIDLADVAPGTVGDRAAVTPMHIEAARAAREMTQARGEL